MTRESEPSTGIQGGAEAIFVELSFDLLGLSLSQGIVRVHKATYRLFFLLSCSASHVEYLLVALPEQRIEEQVK